MAEEISERPVLAAPDILSAFLRQEIGFAPHEVLLAIFVDARFALIKSEVIATGTVSATVADPFKLFSRGKELGAAGIILAHNHPSNDVAPSDNDIRVTNRLKRLGVDLDLPLLEHFIVAPDKIASIPIV